MMGGLLHPLSDRLARVSARWVPDSFSIACLLTLFTLALGITLGGASLRQCVEAWGRSFWELLAFAMQIVVVIFAGYVVAVSPAMTRLLDALAALPRSPRQAVAWTALLSMALCWLNWGMGLIAAAILVRIMARRHPDADYRLLVAVAYLGLGTTWHAGPSGSVPLLLATPDNFMVKGGMLAGPAELSALQAATQDNGQSEIALAGFEERLAAAQEAPRAERFEHGELAVIKFGKGDALGIAIELFVVVEFSHRRMLEGGARLWLRPPHILASRSSTFQY